MKWKEEKIKESNKKYLNIKEKEMKKIKTIIIRINYGNKMIVIKVKDWSLREYYWMNWEFGQSSHLDS
jgi:hypothetical protein